MRLLQVLDRHFDGVAHGRSAAGIDPAQRGFELPEVVGKILILRVVQVRGVVEVDDEDLVVAVGILNQRQRGGFDLFELVAHAAAVVDHQAEGDRNVFALKSADLLLDLVFVDREGGLRKRGHQMAGLIDHRGVADDDARVGAKDGIAFLRRLGHQLAVSAAAIRRQSGKERIIILKLALFLRKQWDRPGPGLRNSRCAYEPLDCPGL